MRVALIHPFSWPDIRRGGERYLHDLAWYLTGQGHEVDCRGESSTGRAHQQILAADQHVTNPGRRS